MRKIDQEFIDTFIEIDEAARTNEAIGRAMRSMIEESIGTSFFDPGDWRIMYKRYDKVKGECYC